MADEAPDGTGDAAPPDDAEEFDADRAKAKIAKANQEAKSLRQRLKELEPLAAKAKEQEDAAKTVEQRSAERLADAERRIAAAESRALRLEVAAEKGLTPNQAKRLAGSTREELEADADDLLETFPAAPAQEATPPNGRPKERMRPGAVPSASPAGVDMNVLIRRGAGVSSS